ncbi:3-oxoacyl-[acyl-carrier protein] reductase [Pedobacter psychrotolerans]|uniref:3-ketoacyl-ACP reductase n=1 Tax=Pedobacter psychrotolerans TaxID=1843235 RepID=A0A4R2HC43_9SPHI|nr:SDR family oxidoreductase [Pedobacter psychrotolerans]TCO25249.1 3-oxoacyl-[acyl-carrier protein] reductase [Pedobacter psychrotolerans]GGE46944.1 3-ketoacyl-ACP reductase [Pedobacter psychrotolerans]
MEIKNARILLTGGTTGIGYETAKLLSTQGAKVVICGRSEESVNSVAKELGIFGIKADVSQEADVERMFAYALENLGGLDVLINNAGLGFMGSLLETSSEDFIKIWETNTKSAFLCGKLAAKHFIEQQSGNIVNISSMGAVRGFANGSAYVSSKAAMSGLTLCWQAELRKHNIRVMQVNPSEVITPFAEKIGHQSVDTEKKLKGLEIAQVIVAMLALNNIAFIPEANVWATNP